MFAGKTFRRVENVRNIFRKAGTAVTIDELLDKYRAEAATERDKGERFERLMKNFLLTYPPYLGQIKSVMLWKNFSSERDLGIDLVAETFDGEYWAVQCKFYAETASVDKSGVDSFISNSGRTFNGRKFSARIFIATTNHFNENADKMFQHQTPPVIKITLEDLRKAPVYWEKLDAGIIGEAAVEKHKPRDYQREAIEKAHAHFQNNSRGKLIMACGTGKTLTALKIAEDLTDQRGTILFLVPSLSLLSQTLDAWTADAEKPLNYICVCSDETVTKNLDDVILEVNLPVTVTNNPADISGNVQKFRAQNPNRMTVVFSTYQSLDKVSAASLDFDLAICDEAHRTAGNSKTDSDTRLFSTVHDNNKIRAKRRLYMTATPRLQTETIKKKAAAENLTVWSMDNEEIFGAEFYRMSFAKAISLGLLSDYRLVVFEVSENEVQAQMKAAVYQRLKDFVVRKNAERLKKSKGKSKEIQISFDVDEMAKAVGCLNALSKRVTDDSLKLLEGDTGKMHKAVLFRSTIPDSEFAAEIFPVIQDMYAASLEPAEREKLVTLQTRHVDGDMDAAKRSAALKDLANTPTDGSLCTIVSNVRCLSEGIDVPSLDAVIFLSPKKSKVEIVQAVGRALRKSDGKNFGYIIVPIIVPSEVNGNILDYYKENNEKYRTIYDVVNALKAHDDAMNADIERLALNIDSPNPDKSTKRLKIVRSKELEKYFQGNLGIFETPLLAKIVEHCGTADYWWHWSSKVSVIVKRHTDSIRKLVSTDAAAKSAFQNFLADLHKNINPTISDKDAVDMLAQHLVSRPVFEAIFDRYSFADHNPVSKSMTEIISVLDSGTLEQDRADLKEFYDSVREQCRDMGDAKNRQDIIRQLYDNFFRQALPREVEKLGIVYTPVEVVDFILRSVSDALKKFFHCNISDKNVSILEPFAGTGTFLARLIQSNLIRPEDLLRKYQEELHANEIVLLAYYIAAVNIENAFHDAAKRQDFLPFNGICLTDTFQTYENDMNHQPYLSGFENPLHENSERIQDQLNTKIQIIIGNPPYSVGQKSANDNAQNVHYDHLEKKIAATYAAGTAATNKNSLYDSYIKAFRWASDRIGASGIIGFITNSGWIDKDALSGLRKCLVEEFSHIFVFNLRGAIRGKIGALAKIEGQNVFDIMTGVAITILVKLPNDPAPAQIHYLDIGDYLSRDDKLARINEVRSVFSDDFQIILPNAKGDWINQRGDSFDRFIILGDKKDKANRQTVFCDHYMGISTNRDAWVYNFSRAKLAENMAATIDFYNSHSVEDNDPKKISWSSSLESYSQRGMKFKFAADKIYESLYRPFCKLNLYFGEGFIHRRGKMDKLFPTGTEKNLLICLSGIGLRREFSVLITDKITCHDAFEKTQCFPLYWYEASAQGKLDGFGEREQYRRDGVTDWILARARAMYGGAVTKEDIFYYVYGFLHLPGYRRKFAAELKKSLPRIILVERVEDFWWLRNAGWDLAAVHLNYETQEPWAGAEVIRESEDLRVTKMKLVTAGDGTLTLVYNAGIKIVGIPARAKEYVVNGRSPLEWLVERYQIKTDKASGIVNDPNDWCLERGEPEYILRLAQSLITVSLKTLDIVERLPEIKFS